MSGVPSVSTNEARGAVPLPAQIDRTCVVIGCSSAGSAGLSPFYSNAPAATTGVGYGDGPDALTQIIARTQVPAAFYKTPSTTAGTYGAIDDSAFTGAATLGTSGNPNGRYEAGIEFVTGGTVGEAGITYRYTLDGWRNRSRIYALGTDDSITIPNSGATFTLSPAAIDLTALNTLLNEIKTDFNAHAILTAGGVHGAADNADVVATADATNTATRIALANALRAAYELHRIKTAGGVHGAADATNVITKPVATDDHTALVLAIEIKTRYNLHRVKVSASTHGAADNTNATTSPDPAAGTIEAGDKVMVRTFGPKWSTDDLDDARDALVQSSVDFGLCVIVGPMSAAEAAHVSTMRAALLAVGKRVTFLCEARLPDFEASETEATWLASVAADYLDFEDSGVHVRATYGIETDAVTARQYLRSDLAEFAANVVRVAVKEWPCAPADRALQGVALVDSGGNLIGHDEGPQGAVTGLSDDDQGSRFGCNFRPALPAFRGQVYTTVPWMMYAPDERIRNLPTRRVINKLERVAATTAFSGLGGTTFYTPADGTTTPPTPARLTESGRNRIHAAIFGRLAIECRDDIQNADDGNLDTGLVQVNQDVTISGGNLVSVSVTLAPLVFGYLFTTAITVAVQE